MVVNGRVGRKRVLARVYSRLCACAQACGWAVGGGWATVVVAASVCIHTSVGGSMGWGLSDQPSARPTVTVTRSKSDSALCDQLLFSPGPAAVQYDKDSRQKRNNAYEKSRGT